MRMFANISPLTDPSIVRPIRPANFGQAVSGFFNNLTHPNTSTTLGKIGAFGQQMMAHNDTLLGQANRAAIAQRAALQQASAGWANPAPMGAPPSPRQFRIGDQVAGHSYLGGDPSNPASWRAF
jgi:hypothetical protein